MRHRDQVLGALDLFLTDAEDLTDEDLTAPTHWPRLSAKAHALGYQSIAGIPWRVEGTTFATLNLQDRDGIIPPETLADAEHIAEELASLLVGSLGQQPPSLDQPADHDTFHQATFIVGNLAKRCHEIPGQTFCHSMTNHHPLFTELGESVHDSHRPRFPEAVFSRLEGVSRGRPGTQRE